jgi:hypothetical protein
MPAPTFKLVRICHRRKELLKASIERPVKLIELRLVAVGNGTEFASHKPREHVVTNQVSLL